MKTMKASSQLWIHGLIILYLLFLIFPLVWVFASSLKSTQELYSGLPTLLPQHITFEHYRSVINGQQIFRSMWNSLIVGV
ncbi:MAG: carbohydrate ABC transporter permease, partial [Bacteroidota bacterium]